MQSRGDISGRFLTFSHRLTFNLPAGELWELFSDTDRVDEAVGLPAAVFRPSLDAVGSLEAHGHYLGLPLRWQERPFEWSSGRWFRVERVYSPALVIRALRLGACLTPLDERQTEVEVFAEVLPRRGLAGTVRLLFGRIYMPRVEQRYRQIVANRLDRKIDPFPHQARGPLDEAQLRYAIERLRAAPVDSGLIDRLVTFAREADDRDVASTRPFELADRWGVERLAVLRLFLHAAKAGLFDVSWEILCPNCRIAKASFDSLHELRPEVHCETCGIDFGANFDEYVELRFSIHPNIRDASHPSFCIGGPANSHHIAGQLRVPPGTTKCLPLDLEPGTYRLRCRGRRGRAMLQAGAGAAGAHIRFDGQQLLPPEIEVGAGAVTIEVANEAAEEIVFIAERDAWGTQGASAALVTSLEEFRHLFASEVLAPGIEVAVRSLTVLFSDLKGSTRIYIDIGDSPAYRLVRDHFDVILPVVKRHRGGLVKTIGDAVMAVFLAPADGITAALEIQRGLEQVNQQHPDRPRLHAKLGLHAGPCVAINANGVLDYFGSTVNLASRVHARSSGQDVVITREMLDDPDVRRIVAELGLVVERFEAELAGFSEAYDLVRISRAKG